MTTNQTIDGVPRELLEALVSIHPSDTRYRLAKEDLRALLDAADHVHEWDINSEGTATVCHCGTRSSDEPAEQPAPVAVVLPSEDTRRTNPGEDEAYQNGWNACLDELKRLNPSL
ncbi:hypothetical protein D7M10_11730 [Pseudomonas fluorescens]|nr:hypothetical protein D7M10_11730 [Pseudomonas fluorescens]